MWRLYQTLSFLYYYIAAKSPRRMHSPYMFDLLTKVFDDQKSYYIFEKIEDAKADLLASKRSITFPDFGAGSRTVLGKTRTVGGIARSAVSSARKCEVLFRLTEQLQPDVTVEVGSSLGISSAYLAAAYTGGKVYSFEGNPELANIARDLHAGLKLYNIELIDGNFDTVLPERLATLPEIDLAYIDGNHRKEPTIRYFQMLSLKRSEHAVFILDDIRWSREMFDTWTEVMKDEAVTATVDAFSFGILFFSPIFKKRLDLMITPDRLSGGPILG